MLISISSKITGDLVVGGTGTTSRSYLQFYNVNVGASFVEVPGSSSYSFHRASGNGANSSTSTHILQVEPGNKLRVRCLRYVGGDTLKLLGNACSITITQL